MTLQHHLECAFVSFIAVLAAAHVKRVSVQTVKARICIDENELRLWIDEFADEPVTRSSIDMDVATRNPPYAGVSCAAACSRNLARASSQRASNC